MEKGFKSLVVWQRSMSLVAEVYGLVQNLPAKEQYALADQIRRAVVSIPSNIAEGNRRGGKKEYVHFLRVANGSLAELETQLLLLESLYPPHNTEKALLLVEEIGKMLFVLIRKLSD